MLTGALRDCQVTSVALSSDGRALTIHSNLTFEHFPSLAAQLDETLDTGGRWGVDRLTLFLLGLPVRLPPG